MTNTSGNATVGNVTSNTSETACYKEADCWGKWLGIVVGIITGIATIIGAILAIKQICFDKPKDDTEFSILSNINHPDDEDNDFGGSGPTTKEKAKEILDTIKDLATKVSPRYILPEEAIQNNKNIPNAKQVIRDLGKVNVGDLIVKLRMDFSHLTDYLKVSFSLANNYLFKLHKVSHARYLLLKAKEAADTFLIGSNTPIFIDLDKIEQIRNEDLLSALANLGDEFIKFYAQILYYLGRTYVSDKPEGKPERQEGVKYLEKAQYLLSQERIKLIEAHLSQANGLGILKREKAEAQFNLGNNVEAQRILSETIRDYDSYILDNVVYKDNDGQDTSPTTNLRCIAECWDQKLRCYKLLIKIDNTANHFQGIIRDFTAQVHFKDTPGFTYTPEPKKQNSVLNRFGELLLSYYDNGQRNIDQNEKLLLINWFKSELDEDINPNNIVELCKKIFDKAIKNGKIDEHTYLESYEGLLLVFKKLRNEALVHNAQSTAWLTEIAEVETTIRKIKEVQEKKGYVAGVIDDSALAKKAILVEDLKINALLLNIEVIQELPESRIDQKLLIIDSDNIRREYATGRSGVEIIYTNAQGNTAACADNALCTVLKARSLGLEAFVYIRDSHAVAVIKYQNNESVENILQKLNSVELQEDEQLWHLYKEVIVGTESSSDEADSKATNVIQVESLEKKLSTVVSDLQAFIDTNNVVFQGIETLKYYISHFINIVPNYIDSLIAELQNIIPKTIAEEANLIRAIEQLTMFRDSYQMPIFWYPIKYPDNDPDDWGVIEGSMRDKPEANNGMLIGNGTMNTTDYE